MSQIVDITIFLPSYHHLNNYIYTTFTFIYHPKSLNIFVSALVSSLATDGVSILVNDAIDKVSSTSVSSFVTDVVSILTKDTLENIDLIFVSSLATDAAYIPVTDEIDKINSTSVSSLVTDANSIHNNDALQNIDSTLTSSLKTDTANIDSKFPLLPFPNTTLLFHFLCITCIDFTYHPLLYHNHSAWI